MSCYFLCTHFVGPLSMPWSPFWESLFKIQILINSEIILEKKSTGK